MAVKINPVKISPLALDKVKEIIEKKKLGDEYGLRVGIKGSGCAGEFIIGFDQKAEHDHEFDVQGIRLLIDKRHTMYLMGVVVDYKTVDGKTGFSLITPEKADSL